MKLWEFPLTLFLASTSNPPTENKVTNAPSAAIVLDPVLVMVPASTEPAARATAASPAVTAYDFNLS